VTGTVITTKKGWQQIPKTNPGKAAQVRTHLKDGVDYYARRPDQDGARANRAVFTRDSNDAGRDGAHRIIDEAPGRFAYRFVMSPDPNQKLDERQLREWTRAVLDKAEEYHRIGNYVAVAHPKQTDQPHVHVVLVSDAKFNVEEFRQLREVGDREQARILERDGRGQQNKALEIRSRSPQNTIER
jgi:hypothetical protein